MDIAFYESIFFYSTLIHSLGISTSVSVILSGKYGIKRSFQGGAVPWYSTVHAGTSRSSAITVSTPKIADIRKSVPLSVISSTAPIAVPSKLRAPEDFLKSRCSPLDAGVMHVA